MLVFGCRDTRAEGGHNRGKSRPGWMKRVGGMPVGIPFCSGKRRSNTTVLQSWEEPQELAGKTHDIQRRGQTLLAVKAVA